MTAGRPMAGDPLPPERPTMFRCQIHKRDVELGRLEIDEALNGVRRAMLWPTGHCPTLRREDVVTLHIGPDECTLLVDDFRLGAGGGWIRLAAPSAFVEPFRRGLFSGETGAAFQQVIAARTAVHAPPELTRSHPAIVVDGPLEMLVEDICARHPGWVYWSGPTALELGKPAAETARVQGQLVAVTAAGSIVRLGDLPPQLGTKLELPHGESGILVSSTVTWQSGRLPEVIAHLGTLPIARRHPPTATIRTPAKIAMLDPFLVEVLGAESAGANAVVRARMMMRTGDAGRFAEEIPLQVGDVILAEIPTGGVSAYPVRVYPYAEGQPAASYRTRSESWTGDFRTMTETFTARTSHVRQRWNVDKAE